MASSNVSVRGAHRVSTHEGGSASPNLSPLDQLERTISTCLLFENTFYEDGASVADRIRDLVAQCVRRKESLEVSALAIHARQVLHLRHAPLLVAIELVRNGAPVARQTVDSVIQRADEPAELLSMWKGTTERRTKMFPKALTKGISDALPRFDAYQLAKYKGRNKHFKLRDVFRVCRPTPPHPRTRGSVVRRGPGHALTPGHVGGRVVVLFGDEAGHVDSPPLREQTRWARAPAQPPEHGRGGR